MYPDKVKNKDEEEEEEEREDGNDNGNKIDWRRGGKRNAFTGFVCKFFFIQ